MLVDENTQRQTCPDDKRGTTKTYKPVLLQQMVTADALDDKSKKVKYKRSSDVDLLLAPEH